MIPFQPMRQFEADPNFQSGDVLAVFGELFARGYANGIVDEAAKKGMKVIYSTVGRRDEQNQIRPLTNEELQEKSQPLINIPLEAGFDMEPAKSGHSPVSQLQGIKMSEWESAKLDWQQVEESRLAAIERFREQTKSYLKQLETHWSPGKNLVFVHTMAGGVPRAKIMMPTMNRVFKGTDDRFLSSEQFWRSDLGRFCEMNFEEVTAKTFEHLIELSRDLREKVIKSGGKVSYLAFGYHGTEILVKGRYEFQYYSPYLQGWAKMKLEEIAQKSFDHGIAACVFNAPEILTNSSAIFQGVEVPLYPLLAALEKEGPNTAITQKVRQDCLTLLKDGATVSSITEVTNPYFANPTHIAWWPFEKWPAHNNPEQMKMMKETSQRLIDMHRDPKNLMTAVLSEVVFQATGKIMLREAYKVRKAVWWLGHDIIAKMILHKA